MAGSPTQLRQVDPLVAALVSRIHKRVIYRPDVAKPGASWQGLVQFFETVEDDSLDTVLGIESMRSSSARVTSEFMRDAIDPLAIVGNLLDHA